MWNYNYRSDNELCHYGVRGMKWGVRKEAKYQQRVDTAKRQFGPNRWKGEVEENSKELARMKKQSIKAWKKENEAEDFSDADAKQLYDELYDYHASKLKEARKAIAKSEKFVQDLDSIDTSSMSYRAAVRKVRSLENQLINDVIKDE